MRIALLALALAFALQAPPALAQRVFTAAPPVAQLETAPVTLVDIRRPEEWQATGVLPNAILLTLSGPEDVQRFAEALRPHLQPGVPVALICRTGNRTGSWAALVAEALQVPVIDIAGGITRYLQSGYRASAPTRAAGCTTC
jgi:rhodanese-related sulfurtransferase